LFANVVGAHPFVGFLARHLIHLCLFASLAVGCWPACPFASSSVLASLRCLRNALGVVSSIRLI